MTPATSQEGAPVSDTGGPHRRRPREHLHGSGVFEYSWYSLGGWLPLALRASCYILGGAAILAGLGTIASYAHALVELQRDEGSGAIELLAFQVALDWMVAGLLSAIFGALMLAVGLPRRLQWVRMVRDE